MGYWIHIYVGSSGMLYPLRFLLVILLVMCLQIGWLWQLTKTVLEGLVGSPIYVTVLLTKTFYLISWGGGIFIF